VEAVIGCVIFCFRKSENSKQTYPESARAVTKGWGPGARGQGFSPATSSLGPGYFDRKRKYWEEKNASNYKIMN